MPVLAGTGLAAEPVLTIQNFPHLVDTSAGVATLLPATLMGVVTAVTRARIRAAVLAASPRPRRRYWPQTTICSARCSPRGGPSTSMARGTAGAARPLGFGVVPCRVVAVLVRRGIHARAAGGLTAMDTRPLIEAAGWRSYVVVFAMTAAGTSAFLGMLVPGETDRHPPRLRDRGPAT